METKLLPCPFCGGTVEAWVMHTMWFVSCNSDFMFKGKPCNARLGPYDTKEEAIEAWNTRHENCCSKPCNPACWKEATDADGA